MRQLLFLGSLNLEVFCRQGKRLQYQFPSGYMAEISYIQFEISLYLTMGKPDIHGRQCRD